MMKQTAIFLTAVMTAILGIGLAGTASADPNIAKQRRIEEYKAKGYGWARINALEAQREQRQKHKIAKRNARAKALARAKRRQIRNSYVRHRYPDFEIRRRRERIRVRSGRRSGRSAFGRMRSPFRHRMGGFRRR
jgi:hypothetical protein